MIKRRMGRELGMFGSVEEIEGEVMGQEGGCGMWSEQGGMGWGDSGRVVGWVDGWMDGGIDIRTIDPFLRKSPQRVCIHKSQSCVGYKTSPTSSGTQLKKRRTPC